MGKTHQDTNFSNKNKLKGSKMKKHIVIIAMLFVSIFETIAQQSIQYKMYVTNIVVAPLYTDAVRWKPFARGYINYLQGRDPVVELRFPTPLLPEHLFAPDFGTNGSRVMAGVVVEGDSNATFTLAGLSGRIIDSTLDNYLAQTITFTQASYSEQTVGWYWGEDQIPGTADDVHRTDGPGTLPVNKLWHIGMGAGFLANTDEDKELIRNYVRNNMPYEITFTYFLGVDGAKVASATGRISTAPIPTPRLQMVRRGNSLAVTVHVEGESDQIYDLERSADFNEWETVGTVQHGSTVFVAALAQESFFRAVKR